MELRIVVFASLIAFVPMEEAAGAAVSPLKLEIISPSGDSPLSCHLGADGGIFRVEGTSRGIYGEGYQLLLFVNPQAPGARGWYLQFGSNGIDLFEPKGSWQGQAQLGNAEYPPKGGEVISIAVVALPDKEAAEALAVAIQAPEQPLRALPQVPAGRLALAKNMVVSVDD